MARPVADVALMLDAMVGFHPSDPISLPAPALPFLEALADATAPLKVAWSADLGFTEVDREIATITAQAAARFSDLGADVVEAAPSFAGAFDAFQTLRALRFANALAPLLERARSQMKPDVIWNIEKGLALTAAEIGKAERDRAALFRRVAAFFEDHDLLACPVMQAPPYAVEATYVDSINGKQLDSYIDWISITFAITLTGCPALSLPCGFTETGLPVGLHLVGKPRGEAALLAAAAKLEGMLGIAEQLPIDPRVRHDQ
jgi:amidase